MKTKLFYLLAALMFFTACSSDDTLSELTPQPEAESWPAPQLSRSAGATSATIAGLDESGATRFQRDLVYDASTQLWKWKTTAAVPSLDGVETMLCMVPAIDLGSGTGKVTIAPEASDILQWDTLHISSQKADKKFYFQNLRHCLSKMCIEVDHYYRSDKLYAKWSKRGTFNYLTGKFESVSSPQEQRIYPTEKSEGIYALTFSMVPQTFEEGERLMRYRDELGDGYRNYYFELDADHVVEPNRTFHAHLNWNDGWTRGSYVAYTVYVSGVSLDKSSLEMKVGETATLTATVSPSDADDKGVSWSSSNAEVATVSNGVVTAVKAGEAVITVTTDDGSYQATCAITVIGDTTGSTESENMGGEGGGNIGWE